MKITMVGTGYVGLVTGVCFADWGHDVVCVDKDPAKISALCDGVMPIFEPGLQELAQRNVAAGRLRFETDLAPAIAEADVAFIAVGTPPRAGDGEADLSAVFAVARAVAGAVVKPLVLVTKSTVPVGTGDRIERIVAECCPAAPVLVASNPEFLREGAAISDFMRPDRVVIGSNEPEAGAKIADLYENVARAGAPIIRTNRRSAELIKYAANAFLATKITFINEIADLCERTGTDVTEIARGMGHDSRIGRSFLTAGPGYGGSCFPKDTLALLRTAQDHGVSLRIVEETVAANTARKRRMARRVVDALGGSVAGKRIAVLGLAFKANTDDIRDSPALPLIETLQTAGAEVAVHDPQAMGHASTILSDVTFHEDAYQCLADADALVIATEWESFRELDLDRIREAMSTPVVIDLRNLIDTHLAAHCGLALTNIGGAGSQLLTESDHRQEADVLVEFPAGKARGAGLGERLAAS